MANRRIYRALVSVSDKTGIVDFVRTLKHWSIEVVSTGGTAHMLADAGIDVVEVSHYTGYPEMMGGRVKTLHPKIHGGLLCVRDDPEHMNAMQELDIKPIDLLVVNLSPLRAHAAPDGTVPSELLEQIDVGGAAMLRGAAKNHPYVAAIADPADYSLVARKMTELDGALDDGTRKSLAVKAFRATAQYDSAIALRLSGKVAGDFPDELCLTLHKTLDLRYGENPPQRAALYQEQRFSEAVVANARQLSGKPLSFNNILDANAALELVREFDEPATAIIAHRNPCGVAVGDDLAEAFRRAAAGDPSAGLKSVAAFNRRLTMPVAQAMCDGANDFAVVITPEVDDDALEHLTRCPKWGPALRVLDLMCGERVCHHLGWLDYRRIGGGFLIQTDDPKAERRVDFRSVGARTPTDAELADLEFAWIVAKHVTSCAIVLAKDRTMVGVGAGQVKRVDAVRIALQIAGDRARGAVMASDDSFLFNDAMELAIETGVTAVAHPGGSRNDDHLVALADEHQLGLVIAGARHFRH